MNQFEGLEEILAKDVGCEFEDHEVIEGELSNTASFLYDATTGEYKIESEDLAEIEEYDDISVVINPETFEGLDIGNCHVSRQDLDGFIDFINYLKEKGEIKPCQKKD